MGTSRIPKIFRHALSVAILACAAMLLLIAYRSTDVSLRMASVKVDLKRGVADVRRVKNEFQAEGGGVKAAGDRLGHEHREVQRGLKSGGRARRGDPPKLDPRGFAIHKPMIGPVRVLQRLD